MSNKKEVQENVPEPQKVVTAVKSLGDIPKRNITVIIERDDEQILIPCKPLSWKRWQEIEFEVVNPVPPIMGVDKNNKPLHNYSDPTYVRDMNKAQQARTMRRLLEFMDIDVPGESVEEKLTALNESLESSIVVLLAQQMNSFAQNGEARIAGRAETFHGA